MSAVATPAPNTENERRDKRIDLRLKASEKHLLEKAAEYTGRKSSDFMRDTLIQKAQEIVEEREFFVLRDHAREAFFDALRSPPKPSATMYEDAKAYLEQTQISD